MTPRAMQPATTTGPAERPALSLLEGGGPHHIVRDDLDRLARQINITLRHANRLLDAQLRKGEIDGHRDALHLLARVEVLAHQVDHAMEVLERLEQRESRRPYRPTGTEAASFAVAVAN